MHVTHEVHPHLETWAINCPIILYIAIYITNLSAAKKGERQKINLCVYLGKVFSLPSVTSPLVDLVVTPSCKQHRKKLRQLGGTVE
jgi:hypothetical protein